MIKYVAVVVVVVIVVVVVVVEVLLLALVVAVPYYIRKGFWVCTSQDKCLC